MPPIKVFKITLSLFCLGITYPCKTTAQSKTMYLPAIEWRCLDSLPASDNQTSLGVAGAFSGISNNMLIVAGGANFPYSPAWKGGKKKYWNKVYVLSMVDKKSKPDKIFQLQFPVAYGASLSLDNGILCVGGKNDSGFLLKVFLLSWDSRRGNIKIKAYPDLPHPLASMAIARVGDNVYIAGGENDRGKQKTFYQLNLDSISSGWQLLPNLPGGRLSDAVLVSQSNGHHQCLYLIGGRENNKDGSTSFFNSVYRYNPLAKFWTKCRSITDEQGKKVTLAAGTACSIGDHYIALFGGDDGILFNRLADYKAKTATASSFSRRQYWKRRYDSLFTRHPGFNRSLLLYNTLTDNWISLDSLAFPTQVTTNIIHFHNKIIIPSGEIRPGIRTPKIMEAKILNQDKLTN